MSNGRIKKKLSSLNNNYNYLNTNIALFGRVTYRLPISEELLRMTSNDMCKTLVLINNDPIVFT
nr:hypothetical protein GTC16762_31580 [Pigmentibacter ruber]